MKNLLLKRLALCTAIGLSSFGFANATETESAQFLPGSCINEASQLTSGKYFIYAFSKGDGAFMHTGTNYLVEKGLTAITSQVSEDSNYIFTITVNEDNTFSVTTSNGLNFPLAGEGAEGKGNLKVDKAQAADAVAAQYSLSDTEVTGMGNFADKLFYVQLSNGTFGGDGNTVTFICTNGTAGDLPSQHFAYWSGTGSVSVDHYTALAFYPAVDVSESEVCSYSVNLPDFNFSTRQVTGAVVVNSDIKTIVEQYIADNGGLEGATLPETMIVDENNKVFTIEGTWKNALAFNKVYRMIFRNGAANDCKYFFWNPANDPATANAATRNATDVNAAVPGRFWYFKDAGKTDSDEQKVTLHTIALSDEYGLTIANANNAKGTMTKEPTEFILSPNNGSHNTYGGFSLRHPQTASDGKTGYANDVAGTIGAWYNDNSSRDDNGSCFRLYSITESDIDNMHLTVANDELKAAAKTGSAEAVRNLFAHQFNANPELLSGYYRIVAVNGNHGAITVTGYADAEGNMTDADETRFVEQVTPSESDLNQLWQFQAYDAHAEYLYPSYVIVTPNANNYHLGTPTGASTLRHQTFITQQAVYGIKVNMHKNANDIWVAHIAGSRDYINASNQNSDIFKWEGSFGDTGNHLSIAKVTTVPVTIPEGSEYTAFCFPMDVTAPDDVKAYYGEKLMSVNDESYIKIAPVAGVISAGQGVIIKGTPGTYNFTINEESLAAAQSESVNLLSGITLKRKNVSADTHFVLAGDKFVKQTEESEVAANSAILPADVLAAEGSPVPATATELKITDVDNPLAISEIEASKAAANVIYDLQGRRVSKAGRGIFIVNGKKVLVK